MTAARTIQRPAATGVIATGEFAFSKSDFREIADIAKSEAGIDLQEAKATLVYSRLAKRLRLLGIETFSDYCALVRTDEEERSSMIAALTTNVTRFFREGHHFEHLKKNVIEPLAAKARRGQKVRLWSAACSTGQEPYSMAMTVLSVIPEAPSLDIRILATDLNPHVVAHGRRGIYLREEIRDVPAGMRDRSFENAASEGSEGVRVCDNVRSLVSFRELNLIGTWPMSGRFDAIFCRNVVIYFDRDTQNRIWMRLAGMLGEGGSLYIGHSERVLGSAQATLTSEGITTYRKKGGAKP